MAEAGQALTTRPGGAAEARDRMPGRTNGQGRLGQLASEYLGERAFRQIALIIGLAAAIAAGIGLVMWVQEPMYRSLFADLPPEDASAVMDALQAANISYELDRNSGSIMVPSERLYRARMMLAAQGLPQTGNVGFESLREDPGFGTSRFLEKARFHRAMETELARTISSLQAVREARVHLAMPERSAFISEQRDPSASVTVGLFPGRKLTSGQVEAIVNMVASAVPELSEDRVTVVDQQGDLLTGEGDGAGGEASSEQMRHERRIEQGYIKRVRSLLAPIVGADDVRAQVDARMDFDVTEQTEERYDPDAKAVRSEQISRKRSTRGNEALGVPGALTNQPPAGGELKAGEQTAAGQGQKANASDANPAGDEGQTSPDIVDTSENETRNYEVSRTVSHTRGEVGEIQRLSVAVLLNQPTTTNDAGDTVADPFSSEQLAEMRSLVKRAVGFDATRGDTIDLVSTRFRPDANPAPAGPPVWEEPWVWEIGRLLLAAILGLLLILMVLRPLIHSLLGRDRQHSENDNASYDAGAGDSAAQQLSGPGHEQLMAERAQHRIEGGVNAYDEKVQAARDAVDREPALAANVVKSWLSAEHE